MRILKAIIKIESITESEDSLIIDELLECGHTLQSITKTLETKFNPPLKRNCRHCVHNQKVLETYSRKIL